MINIIIRKSEAKVASTEILASGTANAVYVHFSLSPHWDRLHKTAVFTNGDKTIDILDENWLPGNVVAIPHEVLAEAGRIVRIGLRGTRQRLVILATPMVSVGNVIPGTYSSGDASTDPALPVWEQLREDFSKRSYACSTELEKLKLDGIHTSLRIHLKNVENIPTGATLHLYRCVRNRDAKQHWEHPVNWNDAPKDRHQHWGYGLIAETPYCHDREPMYPPVPTWMPNKGYMKTEFPISDSDRERGYIDLDLATYLLPLLKPVDRELEFKDCGFIGLQSDGRKNCLLMRFRICQNGEPIDDPGDTLCIGFRRYLDSHFIGAFVSNGVLRTEALYTAIR